MKKRFLSITLVLTIIISMLAGMAVSVGATPPQVQFILDGVIIFNGTYTSAEKPGVITAGSITVNGATLTMNNATIVPVTTASGLFLLRTNTLPSGMNATVELIGTNTITSPGGQGSLMATSSDSTSTLIIKNATGSEGSLVTQNVINVNVGKLEISGCTVSATGGSTLAGIFSQSGATIANSIVTTVGSDGFNALGNIAVNNSTLTVTGNNGYGMYAQSDLSITDSDVTILSVTDEHEGLYVRSDLSASGSDISVTAAQDYGISVSGDISILSATTLSVTSKYDGIHTSSGLITVDGSTVTAVSSHGVAIMGSAPGLGMDEYTPDGIVTSAPALTILNNSIVTATGSDVGIHTYGDMTVTGSTVNATGDYGIAVISGDLTVNSSTVTADAANIENAAIIVVLGAMTSVDINLGTGMIIKNQEVIANFSDIEDSGKVIAPTATVTLISGVLTGASLHAVLCPLGDASVETQNTSTIPQVTLPDEATLENALLTDADRALLANGDDVDFDVVIHSVQAPADAQQVTAVLGQKTLALYLDITIMKTIGETQTAVHDMNSPITITFTIPDAFKGYDNYQLIRVHNGVTTVLQDLDTNPDTVTFTSSQFSTYALVHYNSSPATGDRPNTAPFEAAGMILALLCIAVCVKRYHVVHLSR